MADYYPLIAKAVTGLEKSTGEARRALYDRARTALLAQLRGVEPALSESDITRERLALEEAIRKVEAEAARRSRSDPPPPARTDPPPPVRPEPRQEPRQEAKPEAKQEARPEPPAVAPPPRTAPPPRYDLRTPRPATIARADDRTNEDDDRPEPEETRQAVPLSAASVKPAPEAHQPEERRTPRVPRAPSAGGEAPRAERPRWSPGGGPSLSDKGLKGFRDVVADTETLGSATAQAAKSVRAYQAATNTEFERFESRLEPRAESRAETRAEARSEPRVEAEPVRSSSRRPSPRDAQKLLGREPVPEPGRGRETREAKRGRDAEPQRPSARRQEPPPLPPVEEPEEPPAEDTDNDFDTAVRSEHATRPPSSMVRQEDVRARAPSPPRAPRERAPERKPERKASSKSGSASAPREPRSWKKIVAIIVTVLLVLAVAAVAFWKGRDLIAAIRSTPGINRTTDQTTLDGGTRGKMVERAPTAPQGASDGAMVAQKVVLYEEDQANPNGKQFVGSAVWRTDQMPPGPGQKPEVAVRADIEIPELKIGIRWSLRRNDDKQLPASHTVEIVFTLPPDFLHGGIANIPGVLMKQGETTRGVPLNGVAVKVTTNFFLIGLSSVDADMQRNVQLLKERSWFDIPVVYGDGKRAIIAIEKGTPGERAFTDAFAAWGQ
jgi:hypothetical protein